MKYLKWSFLGFVVVCVFVGINANAHPISYGGITIPAFKGNYISGQQEKYTLGHHRFTKLNCTDNVSGDGRVVLGRILQLTGNGEPSSWEVVPPNEWYVYNNYNTGMGIYKLNLQSNKWLPTAATFWGQWDLGSDIDG